MARIQAGSTLVNQYAPPFVVSDSVAQGWELVWSDTLQAFEAIDPSANVIAAGFDQINAALFPDVTQQVFVVPFIPDPTLILNSSLQKAQFIITIDGVKQHVSAYTINSVNTASNTTTITLDETVTNETVEILGLQTTGGATINIFGPQAVDTNLAGTVDPFYELGWYSPSKESLIVTIDGVKQATSTYSIIPVPNSGYTDTRLTFVNRAVEFNTDGTGVNSATEVITTEAVHGFETGDGVYYSNLGGVVNVGLTDGDLYYVRSLSAFTLSLYDTKVNAENIGFTTGRLDLTSGALEAHSLTRITEPYVYINGNTISLNVAGTGYNVNDVISINGGTPVTEALITVNTVGGSGEILTFTLSNAGEYVVFPSPTTNVATTAVTGTGVNATFDIQKVSPQIEVIGISTTGETPASPVNATNLVIPDSATTFGLYDSKVVTGDTQVLNFKSISAGSNITLTDATTSIAIAADVPVFDANVGTGTDIAVVNVGVTPNTVDFKGINFGERITQTPNPTPTTDIYINFDFGYASVNGAPTYPMTSGQRLLGVNPTAPATVSLPDASDFANGDTVTIKIENGTGVANNVIVNVSAGDLGSVSIDGVLAAPQHTITTAYGYVTLYKGQDGNFYKLAEG